MKRNLVTSKVCAACGQTFHRGTRHGSDWRIQKYCSRTCLHKKHGLAGTPTYMTWVSMVQRCTNPRSHAYPDYGGTGISVCPRWLESPLAFLEDMGERPPGTTIDRIDPAGNYEPGNCRWATPREQRLNNRDIRLLTWNGKTQCIRDWERELGLRTGVIYARLKRGWPLDRALTSGQRFCERRARVA